MRRALGLALVLTACSSSHGTHDAADGGGTIGIVLTTTTLTTCLCHHGCGPGFDGAFDLRVINTTAHAVAVRVTSVALFPTDMPGVSFVTPEAGYVIVAGSASDGSVTVAAGATQTIPITLYLDVTTPPLTARPGTYDVGVSADFDGMARTFTLRSEAATLVTGCP